MRRLVLIVVLALLAGVACATPFVAAAQADEAGAVAADDDLLPAAPAQAVPEPAPPRRVSFAAYVWISPAQPAPVPPFRPPRS